MKLYILHISRMRGQNSRTFILSTFSQARNRSKSEFSIRSSKFQSISQCYFPAHAFLPTFPNPHRFISTTCRFLCSKYDSQNSTRSKIRSEPFLGVSHLPTSWLISLHFRVLLAPRGTPTGRFLARKLGLCHWNYKLPAFCHMARRQLFGQFWTLQS